VAARRLGRSRGGLSPKVHLACDGRGRPLALLLSGGRDADGPHLAPVLEAIRVPRAGRGRPRSRPARVLADKGYSYPGSRRYLRRRGLPHTIPERADHRRHRAHRPGRPPAFDAEAYKRRNVVERCVNRLKRCRALATRYEKTAAAYHGLFPLAVLLLWLPK
jgi:transposase